MKVCIVASFAESILTFRGPLLRAMVDAGVEVHVAAPGLESGAEVALDIERLGVTCHSIRLARTGTNPVADCLTTIELRRLFMRLKPDMVLAYTIKPVIYGLIAAWIAGVPKRFALVTGLGYAFTENRSGPMISLVQWLYRFSLSKASGVFFQNPDDLDVFVSKKLVSTGAKMTVVNGSGVDLDHFQPIAIDGERASFLLIARLLGDKGVREYVAAAKCVRVLYPSVSFVVAGWLDSNPDAVSKEELDEWVNSGTIEFSGRLADVRPALQTTSVYVLPSYREGTPRTVLEAMAMGRPIITTDAPGCRETVIDGDNGFLVPVRSVDALVEAMLKFIEDPGLAPRMWRRSRQIAEDKYDVHKVNAVMLREMGITRVATERETQA